MVLLIINKLVDVRIENEIFGERAFWDGPFSQS